METKREKGGMWRRSVETGRQEQLGKINITVDSHRTRMNENKTTCRYNSCDCRVSFDCMTSLPNIRDLTPPSRNSCHYLTTSYRINNAGEICLGHNLSIR